MVGKGYKAEDVDLWVNFIKERTKYWTGEAKKNKIPSPF
jgi:hypothetical protein